MGDLHVTVDCRELSADWTDTNLDTRRAVTDALPVAGEATRWGGRTLLRGARRRGAGRHRNRGRPRCHRLLADGERAVPVPGTHARERGRGTPCRVARLRDISPPAELPDCAGATVRIELA